MLSIRSNVFNSDESPGKIRVAIARLLFEGILEFERPPVLNPTLSAG
jgi:hypothetical protein